MFPSQTPAEFQAAKLPYEMSEEYRVGYTRRSGGGDGVDEHLGLINAAAAYARGATGAGETLVIADSGFYTGHREFIGKFTRVIDFGGEPCSDEEVLLRLCSGPDHGTSTAAVAAGRRGRDGPTDELNMHGVAFDANIIGIRLRLGAGGRTGLRVLPGLAAYDDNTDVGHYERLLFQRKADGTGFDRSRPWGFVYNFSFGRPHGIASFTREQIRSAFPNLAALFAQANINPADRGIIVWAAGNNQEENYDRDFDGDGELDTCGGLIPIPGGLCPAPSPGADRSREERDAGDPIDATAPTTETALGVHFPELVGHVLAVVAVKQNGHIADFSNHCGIAKNFCLAAPGEGMVAPRRGEGPITAGETEYSYRLWSGTSAAAPVVSGALAVMRSFFKNPDGSYALGNTELVTRMLATADRTNYNADGSGGPDYSDSDTYGQGLLDLDAATRPVGRLSTAMHGRGDAGDMGLDTVGAAFGASFAQRLGGAAVALYDELNAPFFQPAANWLRSPGLRGGAAGDSAVTTRAGAASGGARFAVAARSEHGVAGDLRGLVARSASGAPRQWLDGALLRFDAGAASWWTGWNAASLDGAFGHSAAAGALAAPFFSFVSAGPGAGFSRSIGGGGGRIGFGVQHGAPVLGGRAVATGWRSGTVAALHWRSGSAPLALQFGVLREPEGFLGARATGAMGRASSTTAFGGIGVNWRSGAWRGNASAFFGATDPQTTPGFLREVSGLRSDAFTLSATRRGVLQRGDRFTLSLSQPLRVRSGAAQFRFAAGRTRYGEMIWRDHHVSLRPGGRAIELQAAWQGRLRGGRLGLAVKATRHPDHNAAAGFAGEAHVSFRRQF